MNEKQRKRLAFTFACYAAGMLFQSAAHWEISSVDAGLSFIFGALLVLMGMDPRWPVCPFLGRVLVFFRSGASSQHLGLLLVGLTLAAWFDAVDEELPEEAV